MNCPCCNAGLRSKMIKDVEVHECDECKGMWFEDDELRRAKDSTDEDLNWVDFEIWKHKDKVKARSRNLKCPQCNRSLVAVDYGDAAIEIDYCPQCRGTWLDKGEFKKITEALTEELLTKPFSDYVKTSLQEAREIITGSESFFLEWKDFTTVLRMMRYRLFVEHPKLLAMTINIQKSSATR